jgi:hypothetical protein
MLSSHIKNGSATGLLINTEYSLKWQLVHTPKGSILFKEANYQTVPDPVQTTLYLHNILMIYFDIFHSNPNSTVLLAITHQS